MTSDLRAAAERALRYMESVGQADMYPEEWQIALDLRAALAAEQPQPARIDPMQNPLRPTLAKLGPTGEHPAEEVLRRLAYWLGVGGYNAPTVDADLFHRKIVDGVEYLLRTAAPAEQPQPVAICASEIAKIIRHARAGNQAGVESYALLLCDKLDAANPELSRYLRRVIAGDDGERVYPASPPPPGVAPPPSAPQSEAQPVAVVTECEACFTPDVCQLRGKCDHYSTDWLRVAPPPPAAAPSLTPAATVQGGSNSHQTAPISDAQDAARYRWLRDGIVGVSDGLHRADDGTEHMVYKARCMRLTMMLRLPSASPTNAEIDAAIDAGMQRSRAAIDAALKEAR